MVRDALKWSLRSDLKPSICPRPLFDQRGFSTLHTKFYDKGSALKNFFNAQTSSITQLSTGQYMTTQYSINSGWYSVHYKK